jgi:hypothetical protein
MIARGIIVLIEATGKYWHQVVQRRPPVCWIFREHSLHGAGQLQRKVGAQIAEGPWHFLHVRHLQLNR